MVIIFSDIPPILSRNLKTNMGLIRENSHFELGTRRVESGEEQLNANLTTQKFFSFFTVGLS